jgi:hypothetical protein
LVSSFQKVAAYKKQKQKSLPVGGFAIRLILSHKQVSLFYLKKQKKLKKQIKLREIIFIRLMYGVLPLKSTGNL